MITTVKAFSREAHHQREFDDAMGRLEKIGQKRQMLESGWVLVSGMIEQGVFCACLWLAFVSFQGGQEAGGAAGGAVVGTGAGAAVTAGDLTSFLLLVNQVRGLGNAVAKQTRQIFDKFVDIEMVRAARTWPAAPPSRRPADPLL